MGGHSGSGRGPMADQAREVLLIRAELQHRDLSRDEENAKDMDLLMDLLETMDIPQQRFMSPGTGQPDLKWLDRNLHVNNLQHPDFKQASRTVRRILRR